MPRVSVILPFHRIDAFMKDAIDSVLESSFQDFELVLVSDGVAGNDLEALAPFLHRGEVKLVSIEKAGLVGALNAGIQSSSGDFLARMDSDDICYPDRFAIQVAYLDQNPEVDVVGGQIQPICVHGNLVGPSSRYPRILSRGKLTKPLSCQVAHPTAMMRRETVHRVGGYREFGPDFYAEDLDLWNRILRVGKIHNLSQVVLQYRVHQSQISTSRRSEQSLSTKFAIALDIFETMGSPVGIPSFRTINWQSQLESYRSNKTLRSLGLLGWVRFQVHESYESAIENLSSLASILKSWSRGKPKESLKILRLLGRLVANPIASTYVALRHGRSLAFLLWRRNENRCLNCLSHKASIS